MPKKYRFTRSFTFEGKRYYVYADTEKEAERKLALKERDLKEGRVILNGSMTVREWSEECIETYKAPHLSGIALDNVRIRVRKYITGPIGYMRLKDVKPLHLQRILNDMEGMSAITSRRSAG